MNARCTLAGLVSLLGWASIAPHAVAQDADARPERAETETETREDPPPRRPVPDYDGRPPPGPRPDERAAYVPRVALSPLYAVAEYVVRRPFGFAIRRADPERVYHFFRFGRNERITLAPVFSYDLGFRPQVGLLFRAREVGTEGHSITGLGAFGGKRWYAGRVIDTFRPQGSRVVYSLMVEAISRPDGLFFGLGGDVTDDFRARYHWVGTTEAVAATVPFRRQSRAMFRTGHRYRQFDDDVGDRLSIEDRIAQGAPYTLPPGYEEGYSLWFADAQLEVDTRRDRPERGDGIRFTLDSTTAFDVRDGPSALSFIVYGGALGGFVDLSGVNHVLSLTAAVVFSDAFRGEIPFTELPSLAGDGPLSGFLKPYLYADSGAALLASYTWPIWSFLDGKLDVGVGNGFDGHLDGFTPGRLRLSATVGIAAFNKRLHFLELAFGVGTDEFEDGPNVDQVRFVIGLTRGF